jgi:prevent-host-death family protein
MREVPATEAKAHLSELLRSVEFGESIVITRHGTAVAHLVPAQAQDRATRAAAVARFRRRRASWGRVEMSTQEILAARHEGHRL